MLQVLYEDNHCIAVLKPARVLTAGDRTGDESLLDMVRVYLKQKYEKPGNVFVGLVHRLDRPVSGVVLFARTSKAAARLSAQFREGTIQKTYRALVEGALAEPGGELLHWLLKDEEKNAVQIVPANTRAARKCRLKYRRVESGRGVSLVEITPLSGRSHQIRAQLAFHGHPILGDRKYGSRRGMRGTIALHASQLMFEHPTRHEPVTVSAPDPAAWRTLLAPRRGAGS